MIKDLNLSNAAIAQAHAQVCIVGAGTSGIFLAHQLRCRGVSVIVVEAGDSTARKPEDLGQICEQRGIRYRGADLGRSFGLGGTSVLWGGQMLPLARYDLQARSAVGLTGWPIAYEDIAAYFPMVRKVIGLGVVRSEDDAADAKIMNKRFPLLRVFSPTFNLRLSTWIPFKRRNFAKGFGKVLRDDVGLTVWLNASVVDIQRLGDDYPARIESVTAASPKGQKLVVKADVVVICAGALESTRLLLAFDEDTAGSITTSGAPLGRYFSDHLSVTCGRIRCRNWQIFNKAIGATFQRGLMFTPRLELSAQTQEEQSLTSAFFHFIIVTNGGTGFDVVRNILRRLQGKSESLKLTPVLLCRAVIDVFAMAYWNLIHRRLWIPRQADVLLQVDIEQVPNPDSRLSLSGDRDQFGRKRLVVDWRIKPEDVRVIRRVVELIAGAWQKASLHDEAALELTIPQNFENFDTFYDVYHPTGSLRMGSSPTDSVVDQNLRLWAADNCYVSTTAVFPTAGSANPGMMHLALTARLADHIEQRLKPRIA